MFLLTLAAVSGFGCCKHRQSVGYYTYPLQVGAVACTADGMVERLWPPSSVLPSLFLLTIGLVMQTMLMYSLTNTGENSSPLLLWLYTPFTLHLHSPPFLFPHTPAVRVWLARSNFLTLLQRRQVAAIKIQAGQLLWRHGYVHINLTSKSGWLVSPEAPPWWHEKVIVAGYCHRSVKGGNLVFGCINILRLMYCDI